MKFPDVPSSPFAIGSTLNAAFLLDYYFLTFRTDPQRATNAAAWPSTWLWTPCDVGGICKFGRWIRTIFDGARWTVPFLTEPNSGRDWAGLACANEVGWVLDSLTQVYVHTGDARPAVLSARDDCNAGMSCISRPL